LAEQAGEDSKENTAVFVVNYQKFIRWRIIYRQYSTNCEIQIILQSASKKAEYRIKEMPFVRNINSIIPFWQLTACVCGDHTFLDENSSVTSIVIIWCTDVLIFQN